MQTASIDAVNASVKYRQKKLLREPKSWLEGITGSSSWSTGAMTEQDVARIDMLRPLRVQALAEGRKGAYRAYSKELFELTNHFGYTA